jgi:hypothetical protein
MKHLNQKQIPPVLIARLSNCKPGNSLAFLNFSCFKGGQILTRATV